MMKPLLLYLVLFFGIKNADAQINKKFYNKNGKETKDSTKAVAYLLYQKTDQDSVWSAVMLDMHRRPIFKGSYLDEELTIPVGKFVTYQNVVHQHKVSEHQSSLDTVIAVKQTGYYINGLKEGIWITYFPNGNKQSIKTFENNELNGLFEEYDDNEIIFSRCNYIKGLREGDSYIFRADSSVASYNKFWHGNSIESKEYDAKEQFYHAYPGFNFNYHVLKYLKKTGLPPAHGNVVVAFTVTAEGKLTKPEVQMGVNPMLDEAVVEAINNSPSWVCARLNNKRVDQKISLAFSYDTFK